MTYVPTAVRQLVIERAGQRCKYYPLNQAERARERASLIRISEYP